MNKLITAAEAAGLINSNAAVLVGGSGGGHGVPETVLEALSNRYIRENQPKDLTLISIVSIGNWESKGFSKLAIPGLIKCVISAGLNNSPQMAEMAKANEIEAYLFPQGVLSQLCRDTAGGRPGLLTQVGLRTFADPRLEGGKQSECSTQELVRLVQIDGEDYLLYKSLPVDVAIIRGTTADESGNITADEEPYAGELFSIASAARRRGGIVIAQVKNLAADKSLPSRDVKVPGALVNYIVVDSEQSQTYQTHYNPAYAGKIRMPINKVAVLPLDIRKVIARRAAYELFPGDLVNLGFGVSTGISLIAAEEGIADKLTLTAEQGIFRGITAGEKDLGAGVNFDAMIDQSYQFDLKSEFMRKKRV